MSRKIENLVSHSHLVSTENKKKRVSLKACAYEPKQYFIQCSSVSY